MPRITPTTLPDLELHADSVDLLLRDAGRFPLLKPEQEIELAKRIERGDLEAKELMINSNLRLVVSIARRYVGHGPAMLGPGPGGDDRPDPRSREVRLAQGLPLLDLRDALDPPVDPARPGQLGAHGPPARRRRPARAQGRPRHERPVGQARARPVRRRDRRGRPAHPGRGPGDPRGRPHAGQPEQPGRRGRRRRLGHFIANEGPAPEDEVHAAIAAVEVQRALDELPEPERKVISLRFGTSGDAPQTPAQTARQLGVTPREAASLEEKALRKLASVPQLAALREAA